MGPIKGNNAQLDFKALLSLLLAGDSKSAYFVRTTLLPAHAFYVVLTLSDYRSRQGQFRLCTAHQLLASDLPPSGPQLSHLTVFSQHNSPPTHNPTRILTVFPIRPLIFPTRPRHLKSYQNSHCRIATYTEPSVLNAHVSRLRVE
ncbi:hypothetical protein ACOSP7_017195 [Xanthoceras sorbifolium]